ncbi:ferredoxin-2, mitochondrial [Trichonephila inaurata madagascariensis]|uniref:Ferredoxin-2, mitochondrial n=1 Tax=Trichonephila inaurata madagascariensis TaxID=2747483 RepID=A0A8X7C895_9ARAC|nr:ferredoxin-2, mitochondrial [Trichonephila inaurata madagascariensis]
MWALIQNPIFNLQNINTHISNTLLNNRARWFSSAEMSMTEEKGEKVKISFVCLTGEKVDIEATVGQNVLQVATENNIGMEGACEGNLTCTTCHVYVDEKSIEMLPEPSEKENDLLDIAPFLKETSRLGCQCELSKDLDGAVFTLPIATINMKFKKSNQE